LNSGRNLGETLTFLCWTFLSDCVWSHCAFCLTPTKRQVCIQCVRLCVVSIVVFFLFSFWGQPWVVWIVSCPFLCSVK
jgi:hypothetical protein